MQWNDVARLTESEWIQRIEFHQSLPSTNDQAALLAAEECLACPALVIAAEQSAGRGRGGNRWWSAAGGLMFSLVHEREPKGTSAANWSGYSLTAGLAVCEALEAVCPSAQFTVKWPNDVYANERKICGILSESPASARGRLIVGIGVNVNNSFLSAPPELAETATAVCDLDGLQRDLITVLQQILANLQRQWTQLNKSGFGAISADWQVRSLLTGRTVQLRLGQQIHIGRCLGIDDDGALLLQTEAGRQSFAAGSILRFE